MDRRNKYNYSKSSNQEEQPQPLKKVAVLKYDDGDVAPILVAKGQGTIAEKILEEGEKHDIPVYKDKKLVTLLNELEIGEQIPEALYNVVAEVLLFVSDIDELYKKHKM